MNIETILLIGSVLTAIGVIYGFVTKWGGALSELMVKIGWKRMKEKDVEENTAWKQQIEATNKMSEAVAALSQKLDVIHNDLCENTKLTLKQELKDLFRNHPERIDSIEDSFNQYRSLHGNSYIEELYNEWKENYLNKIAEDEVKNIKNKKGVKSNGNS